MDPDYPIADYVPMAATALTDAERWPLLTAAGATMLARLRDHPLAPAYNHACGDRLTAAARARLRGYPLAGYHGWTADTEPDWLPALIARCYAQVPRYRRLGAAPATLAEVPPTTRHDLLDRVEDQVPDDADLAGLIVYRTSGSRGPASTVPMTPEFNSIDLPVFEHILARLGVRLRRGADTVALVNVYHQPLAYQFCSVLSYLDDAGLVKLNLHPAAGRTAGRLAEFLDDLAPQLYSGNPISLAALAELPLRTRPAAIVSGAMALGSGLRSRLAERFGCPVIDLYGLTEAGPIAWRAGPDDDFEVLPRRLYLETVAGELLVTCGENPLLPLLRYRTGDHADLHWVHGVPRLHGLDGRAPVEFRAASGAVVNSIEVTHLLSPLGLVAWQLRQRADDSLDLRVHPAGAPTPATLAAAVRSLLGNLPLTVTPADLAADAKPQRYSSEPAGDSRPAGDTASRRVHRPG